MKNTVALPVEKFVQARAHGRRLSTLKTGSAPVITRAGSKITITAGGP